MVSENYPLLSFGGVAHLAILCLRRRYHFVCRLVLREGEARKTEGDVCPFCREQMRSTFSVGGSILLGVLLTCGLWLCPLEPGAAFALAHRGQRPEFSVTVFFFFSLVVFGKLWLLKNQSLPWFPIAASINYHALYVSCYSSGGQKSSISLLGLQPGTVWKL